MPAGPGRPRSPEGRRNNVCAKLSDAEFAAVEEARGSIDRSEWARLALLAAAERQRPPASRNRTAPKLESASELARAVARRGNGGEQ